MLAVEEEEVVVQITQPVMGVTVEADLVVVEIIQV